MSECDRESSIRKRPWPTRGLLGSFKIKRRRVPVAEHLLFRYDERLSVGKRSGAISGGAMRRLLPIVSKIRLAG